MLRAMPDWVAIVLRPLVLVALLFAAMYLAHLLQRLIPDGRVNRFLYAKHEIVPRDFSTVSRTERRVATTILLVLAAWITVAQLLK